MNSTYSVGDYLRRAVVRPYKRAEVDPFLDTSLASFHRKLRDSVDHGRVLNYGRSKIFRGSEQIIPFTTFPIADVRVAATYGMVNRTRQLTFEPIFVVFLPHHLDAELVPLLDNVKNVVGTVDDLSVMLVAERYLEGLRSLTIRAESEYRVKGRTVSP